MTRTDFYYPVCIQRNRLYQAEEDIMGRTELQMEEDNEVFMSNISVCRTRRMS